MDSLMDAKFDLDCFLHHSHAHGQPDGCRFHGILARVLHSFASVRCEIDATPIELGLSQPLVEALLYYLLCVLLCSAVQQHNLICIMVYAASSNIDATSAARSEAERLWNANGLLHVE